MLLIFFLLLISYTHYTQWVLQSNPHPPPHYYQSRKCQLSYHSLASSIYFNKLSALSLCLQVGCGDLNSDSLHGRNPVSPLNYKALSTLSTFQRPRMSSKILSQYNYISTNTNYAMCRTTTLHNTLIPFLNLFNKQKINTVNDTFYKK